MAANFKLEWKQWSLETDKVPPVYTNFQLRTLSSRNTLCDTGNRQIDKQTSKGQKPDIPPRSHSQKIHSRVTPDISTRLQSAQDKIIGNTFKQDSLNYLSQPLDMKGIPSKTHWMSHCHKHLYMSQAWENKTSPPNLNFHV